MYLNFSIYAKIHFKEFQLINVICFSIEPILFLDLYLELKDFTDKFS